MPVRPTAAPPLSLRTLVLAIALPLTLLACGGSDGGTADSAEVTADVDAEGVDWRTTAAEFRGQDGTYVGFGCPSGGEAATVWGTDPYTDDSSVCTAAVHAGVIDFEDGGRVIIQIAPGEEAYEAGEANGVTTTEYPAWPGSFTVVTP